MTKKVCKMCSAEFPATRKDRRWCSERCRKDAHKYGLSSRHRPAPQNGSQLAGTGQGAGSARVAIPASWPVAEALADEILADAEGLVREALAHREDDAGDPGLAHLYLVGAPKTVPMPGYSWPVVRPVAAAELVVAALELDPTVTGLEGQEWAEAHPGYVHVSAVVSVGSDEYPDLLIGLRVPAELMDRLCRHAGLE